MDPQRGVTMREERDGSLSPTKRSRGELLRRRIRWLLLVVITGLVLSGLTAFPIETELRWATRLLDVGSGARPDGLGAVMQWLVTVRDAVIATNAAYPFLAYGTDWLAFAHLVIAVAFIGPLRDPVRNAWIITSGLIACVGIFALALLAGPVRGIPWFWTLVDCSFGVGCGIPLLLCRRYVRELEANDTP
jgi:hypothetical protein